MIESQAIKKLIIPGGHLCLENNYDIIWPEGPRTHAIVISPAFLWNANLKGGFGDWEHAAPRFPVGEKRELFVQHPHGLSYEGTFECVDSTTVVYSDFKELTTTQESRMIINTLSSYMHTTPFLLCLIDKMYGIGILKVRCAAIKMVSFNDRLYKSLIQKRAPPQTQAASTSRAAKKPAKRKSEAEPVDAEKPSKKRKKAPTSVAN
ncbi:hypothetical protein JAAARDRAFT_644429 [Jaapia argillacea MUCL 33604]|uniref:Uncharacterized protein n=1 Tax=Jaapia argillacea MUCL 33604 TaxID=933084 RepID=A0A067P3L5_9AGAM|nr:hypothetical protein JAAARDRAFT_644429 [Jaapia argillacea MUCL 33604]